LQIAFVLSSSATVKCSQTSDLAAGLLLDTFDAESNGVIETSLQ
jgi:hypothetical protein